MRLRAILTSFALLPALAVSMAAEPEEGCRLLDETDAESPILCETPLHMQCPADDLEKVHDPTTHIPLADGAPDRSVTEGAGCGTVDEPVFGSTSMAPAAYEYSATGYFTGNVDTATFELHFLGPGAGQLDEAIFLDTRVTIDGRSVFGDTMNESVAGDVIASPTRIRLEPEVVQSDTGASVGMRFTVTGIGEFIEGTLSDPDAFHTVTFTVNTPHLGMCEGLPPNGTERCVPAGLYSLVWGTTEVPSNVTMNLDDSGQFGTVIEAGEKDGV